MEENEKDYETEYECLMALSEAGRTDGDGPADVAEIVEVDDDGEQR